MTRHVLSWSGLCLALMMTVLAPGLAAGQAQEPTLENIIQNRVSIAKDLIRPVAHCVARQDTEHPAFHGCYDWHSSVHGTWALIAYTLMTEDDQYVPLIRETLDPNKVALERQELNVRPQFEMPYGRAWFLRLVIDYENWSGKTDLTLFGDEVAKSMLDHYRAHMPDPFAKEYRSSIWALRNLLDYASHRTDIEMDRTIADMIRTRFMPLDFTCDPESERGGFMAVCSNWAALVWRVTTHKEFAKWYPGFLPEGTHFTPVTKPRNTHEYGLNFSRSWGLAGLCNLTRERKWGDLYAAHFYTAYRNPEFWDGDYTQVAHWVPQFGIYALRRLLNPVVGCL